MPLLGTSLAHSTGLGVQAPPSSTTTSSSTILGPANREEEIEVEDDDDDEEYDNEENGSILDTENGDHNPYSSPRPLMQSASNDSLPVR